eukprot:s545_g8.t1
MEAHSQNEEEVDSTEMTKWREMMSQGIAKYMEQHPDRFKRRVRRGIPPEFRWRVWKAAAQLDEEPLADYGSLCDQENKWTASIEIDVPRTFPELKAFDEEQQQRLRRVLNAYASYNPDCGYCQGMNYVAGLLLLVSRCEEESFWVFVRLMDHEDFGLGGFYVGRLPLLRRYLRACENLVAESLPELREHFIKQNVQPAVYLHQWFLTLFINCFPISMVMILWDVIMCEGLTVILRIAVSILQVLKDSLLSMEFEEIIKFFKMMKTYHDEDGELGAVKIGQLLMKHTEQVHIPKETIQYLRAGLDDDPHLDSDESWENEQSSWSSYLSRMFSWRKSSTPNTLRSSSAPEFQNASAPESNQGLTSRGSAPNMASTGAPAALAGSAPEEESYFGLGSNRGWEFL